MFPISRRQTLSRHLIYRRFTDYPCNHYSLVFAKNTSVSRKFGENSSKISAGGGILGKDERVHPLARQNFRKEPQCLGNLGEQLVDKLLGYRLSRRPSLPTEPTTSTTVSWKGSVGLWSRFGIWGTHQCTGGLYGREPSPMGIARRWKGPEPRNHHGRRIPVLP